MNRITIFRNGMIGNIENNDTVVHCEMPSISLDFKSDIIHYTFSIAHFIDGILQTYCAVFGQHLRKTRSHLIICYIVTDNNHLNSNLGYVRTDLQAIKQR